MRVSHCKNKIYIVRMFCSFGMGGSCSRHVGAPIRLENVPPPAWTAESGQPVSAADAQPVAQRAGSAEDCGDDQGDGRHGDEDGDAGDEDGATCDSMKQRAIRAPFEPHDGGEAEVTTPGLEPFRQAEAETGSET